MASAQKFGGEVYKDDLSLESYLDIVGVIPMMSAVPAACRS